MAKAGAEPPSIRPLPARPRFGWSFWCVWILPAGIVPAIGVADALLPGRLFARPLLVIAVFFGAGLLVLIAAGLLIRLWNKVRREIISHAGLLCPRCRYPLDRLPSNAPCCPECGTVHDRDGIVRLWRRFLRLEPGELPEPSSQRTAPDPPEKAV